MAWEIKPSLQKKLRKLEQRSSKLLEQVFIRIEGVITHPEKGKPLKKPMQGFRRIHLDNKKYVLLYKLQDNTIIFEDLEHHDKVYK